MKKGVLIFGVAFLAYIRSAHPALETVWLKDVNTRFSSDKRTFSDLDHPDELTFNLRRGSGDLTLNLKRNYDIDPNADIYFGLTSKDGRSILVKTPTFGKKDVAYYQDMENGAFMTVRCVKRSNEQCDRDINGNIQIGDSSYELRPDDTDVTSRNLLDVPDPFAERYVLQDQAYSQRENSVQNKDAGNINEKKVEEELTALFRRFEGQHKQTHVYLSDDTLSSRNIIALHNRAATDKSRQLKKNYYVKIAVLIDSGTWDLYSSMVSSLNPVTRSRKVKRKIRESYSHIMNGVNMRYKGIQDRTISISIILSRFIFFKRKNDFKQKKSKVIAANGTNYIDVRYYLADLEAWDNDIGKKYAPSYDHAMLFTRHAVRETSFLKQIASLKMSLTVHSRHLATYKNDGYRLYDYSSNQISSGISFNNDVCDVGGRVSVIGPNDYLLSSLIAAHELGHNLGASHDGQKNATACKSEEFFIMTTKEPSVHPDMPYSRNLWIFSNCSVEAFKRNLKNKECVRHPGLFYDEQEYKEYVMKQPGEVYTPNDQCHFIAGHGSVYCGPEPVSSCYFKCTDPSTGRCKDIFYHAARGTQCGHNMEQTEAFDTQPCVKSDTFQDPHDGY